MIYVILTQDVQEFHYTPNVCLFIVAIQRVRSETSYASLQVLTRVKLMRVDSLKGRREMKGWNLDVRKLVIHGVVYTG